MITFAKLTNNRMRENSSKWAFPRLLSTMLLVMATSAWATDMSRPWTFWYWMYGAVSEAGIKADLQAMSDVGLGGCYLMPIRGTAQRPSTLPPLDGEPAEQLTPRFWHLVDYAMQQADSLGLEMGIHVCDGFALAGGPWIAPSEAMQKVVFADTIVTGQLLGLKLPQPQAYDGYYEDIATYAYPMTTDDDQLNLQTVAGSALLALSPTMTRNDRGIFAATEAAWLTYDCQQPRTFRNIEIAPNGTNLQGQRMRVEASDDGRLFRTVRQLTPPRQGWQNYDHSTTFAFPPTTARYWRLSWTPEGTEPGSEDMDAAKWRPRLGLKNATLRARPRIDNWEGKAGYAWRIAQPTDSLQAGRADCVSQKDMVRIELADGRVTTPLRVDQPYRIVRMGHTATGYTNATAGGAKGLECDKLSKAAVEKQIDHWFGEFMRRPHAKSVVKFMHVDSWECGCQNWTAGFADEFRRRRGYDLLPWLPLYAGIPIESAARSEQVLRDIRQTIGELVVDVFFATISERAHRYGVQLSSESVAPTMVSDGMAHYRHVDLPMGEYWLNSPTHDKPTDMLDAISGAHVYAKPIVQAEGMTEVRGTWDETPASVKPLIDRNFCLGMNRLFFHVNTHNPWLDRKPGMTLDGIGLFFQRDQTWFAESKALVDYVARCQSYLQQGRPVVDIAVYIGDEMPRRALTPDRLVSMLPGLFGAERVASEKARLANVGQPMEESPVGVRHSAGILDLKDWVNPLHGYHYDSMNPDGLAHWVAQFDKDPNDAVLPPYRVLVVPQHVMVSKAAQQHIDRLRLEGITVITQPCYSDTLPGLPPDAILPEGIDFAHRRQANSHYFFLSNQTDSVKSFRAKLRVFRNNGIHILINPVTGEHLDCHEQREGIYSCVDITLPAHGSMIAMSGMIIHDKTVSQQPGSSRPIGKDLKWKVSFTENGEQLTTRRLFDWSQSTNDRIRYYSGHVRYTTTFQVEQKDLPWLTWLQLPDVRDVAHVWLNGHDLGIAWTPPYMLPLQGHLRKGKNTLEIEVANTWHNALRGSDQGKSPYDGIWTNASYRTKGNGLLPAGLLQTPLLVSDRPTLFRVLEKELSK